MNKQLSPAMIEVMFAHLMKTHSEQEARDLLIEKYPDSEGDILIFNPNEDTEVELVTPTFEAAEAEVEAEVEAQPAEKPAKAKKESKVKAPKAEKPAVEKKVSKVDQARELFQAAEDKSRGAMIKVFMEKLGFSKAAASTYFYNIRG